MSEGRSAVSREKEPPLPPELQYREDQERIGTADTIDSLDEAAELLTRHYMNLRISGSLSEASAPTSARKSGSSRRKKSAKADKPMPMLPPPKKKLYTPGPGAYSPQIDRYAENSLHSRSYSFGGGRLGQTDRSFLKHYLSQQSSPGPMYVPDKNPVSTLRSVESLTFGKSGTNSRNVYNYGAPTNSPVHNPGPGAYESVQDKKGNKVAAGHAEPSHSFGKSSFHQPQLDYKKTMYLSSKHEVENLGVHSPGPKYYPGHDSSSKFNTIPAYTTRPKGKISWDAMLDPKNNYGPGPEYHPTVHESPKYGFKREYQRPAPSTNLSASTFITERHAKTANHSIHSPGPIYYPAKPELHKP
eukprot:CAMPEP_0177795402 /NCGR_PEP_ID=MMETSP0491_2-20121128/26213_1 /TAXON_ID=63592 /ORGANISM="Tetraselmis chuii, Strain PLY429" /LENGTH=356 /DNA_ID=CAMNT_0019318229 /DNA_START=303 /DNA_END=1370 /DNA_ORIENTATION=-